MSGARRRTPCETESCDSTSLGYNVADTYQSRSQSHIPSVDRSGLDDEKLGSLTDSDLPSMTSDPGFLDKKPDSTYPEPRSPPPYCSGFSENNVQNYTPAGVQPDTGMSRLLSVSDLPVTALGYVSLYQLSLRLDPEILPAQNWKMMADYMGFNLWETRKFEEQPLKAKAVIDAWAGMGTNGPHTIGELLNIIQDDMNRVDVITDLCDLFLKDADRYKNRRNTGDLTRTPSRSASFGSYTSQSSFPSLGAFQSLPDSYNVAETTAAEVTLENICEKPPIYNESRPVQVPSIGPSSSGIEYDAFILCNIADKEFVVDKFLPKVEDEAGLRLCFTDRDLPPGNLAFVHQMDYMVSKCKKLVVILSDEFFKSREHDWQSNLAISQDPASKQQRIIPVKYKKISTRNIFDHLGCCDLTRTMREEWFWNKIIKGIKS